MEHADDGKQHADQRHTAGHCCRNDLCHTAITPPSELTAESSPMCVPQPPPVPMYISKSHTLPTLDSGRKIPQPDDTAGYPE